MLRLPNREGEDPVWINPKYVTAVRGGSTNIECQIHLLGESDFVPRLFPCNVELMGQLIHEALLPLATPPDPVGARMTLVLLEVEDGDGRDRQRVWIHPLTVAQVSKWGDRTHLTLMKGLEVQEFFVRLPPEEVVRLLKGGKRRARKTS